MTKEQISNVSPVILPKRPELASYANRLKTFEGWPLDHRFTKEQIARAGLYYTGRSDCTRCYYCGGAVRNWKPEDDVWLEHARWFPCCTLVVTTLGLELVGVVRLMQNNHEKITLDSVATKVEQLELLAE